MDALLANDDLLKQNLQQHFVLFKPKDIVSGDFYWMYNTSVIANDEGVKQSVKKDELIFFAAADCTGHGVPGAFMSIVGHNLLDKIVGEYHLTSPAEILNYLNEKTQGYTL